MNAFERARLLTSQRESVNYATGVKTTSDKERTLVIIDMQSRFMQGDEDRIVPAICSLVRHAKHEGWAIIVVEFYNHGELNKEIHDNLVGYQHWATVYKRKCDGSNQILNCIREHPSWSINLLICGVYGPECVAETVAGLFDNSDVIEVDIVTDAIDPDYCSCTESDDNDNVPEVVVTVADVIYSSITRSMA